MAQELSNLRVAILVEDNFEQVEMTEPRKALHEAGADTVLISRKNKVTGWTHHKAADIFTTDRALDMANDQFFDALLLPGGVMNADALRLNHEAIEFVLGFTRAAKPIAAICHAPWVLIEAEYVKGKKITSWPSLKTDLKNAGADWVDMVVAEAPGLITSRKPADIPAFNKAMVRLFAASPKHSRA